jgi:hypothetical protein
VIAAGIAFGYTTLNVHSVTKWVTGALARLSSCPTSSSGTGGGSMATASGRDGRGHAQRPALPLLFPAVKDVALFLSIRPERRHVGDRLPRHRA